mgnify:CR=1 FL=1
MDETQPETPATGIPGKPLSFWKQQVDLSLAARRQHESWWDANLRAYAPKPNASPESYASEVNTNRDFVLVERKKADLFYQRPEVTLTPTPLLEIPLPRMDPLTGQPAVNPQNGQPITDSQLPAITAHEQIVNELLGPDGVNAVLVTHQALFDVLCTSGIGFTVMGYESVTQEVEQPGEPVPDPVTGELMEGESVMVPVPIYENCFWNHISPKRMVIPHDATTTDWDKLAFLGFQFTLPLNAGTRKKYGLPETYQGSKPSEEMQFAHGTSAQEVSGTFTGVELWYKSSLFRDDILHPEHLTHLVMVDGLDEPAIHEDCPYQSFDDRGRLTPDSLIGFPVHPLNTRVLTDSAYPPSDCTIIRPLVNELNVFRRQMVEYRDAQTLRWTYNTDTLPPDALAKIVREIGRASCRERVSSPV